MDSRSSQYPRHPAPGDRPALLYGVLDWGTSREPATPRFTAVVLPRPLTAKVSAQLHSRWRSFVDAQRYADKLNAATPYPAEAVPFVGSGVICSICRQELPVSPDGLVHEHVHACE